MAALNLTQLILNSIDFLTSDKKCYAEHVWQHEYGILSRRDVAAASVSIHIVLNVKLKPTEMFQKSSRLEHCYALLAAVWLGVRFIWQRQVLC